MGNWSMHIEGHGIHDNALPGDADAMLKAFAGELAGAGHQIHSATITIGAAKELLNADESTPLRAGETQFRPIP
jgi:hypothetical protein